MVSQLTTLCTPTAKNLFGDIIAIYQGTTKVAEYAYDAYGNCTIVSDTGGIGTANPFRYRGYYWDNDLQLYYLMSRYYDPQTGRFINADSLEYLDPETIGGLNLYAYCGNNPVMYVDPTGHVTISLLVGLVISFVVGVASSAISQYDQYDGDINWFQAVIDGLFAVASTALAYTGITLLGSVIAGAGLGLAQYIVDSAVFHDDFTWSGAIIATGVGALSGLASNRGAQHSRSVRKSLDKTGKTGVKALTTAFNKYADGPGYQKVLNLWGGRVAESIEKAVAKNFTKGAIITWVTTALGTAANNGLNKIDW